MLDGTLSSPTSRHSNGRSEIRNAVAGVESSLKEGSDSNAYCDFINQQIVMSRILSERLKLWLSNF